MHRVFVSRLLAKGELNTSKHGLWHHGFLQTGTYTLKFTDNIEDVRTDFDWNKSLKIAYETKIGNYGLLKGLLKFLEEDIGIEVIKLYRIKQNGTVKEKSLNTKGNINSDPCN